MNQRGLNPQFHRILDLEPLTVVSSENGRELLVQCCSDDATTIVLQMSEKLALDTSRSRLPSCVRKPDGGLFVAEPLGSRCAHTFDTRR